MKKYTINGQIYEVIENHKDGFKLEEIELKITDYFNDYDYILGDWAYGKVRLKGFCNQNNPIYKPINSYLNKKQYIEKYCTYDCSYFLLKKINPNK